MDGIIELIFGIFGEKYEDRRRRVQLFVDVLGAEPTFMSIVKQYGEEALIEKKINKHFLKHNAYELQKEAGQLALFCKELEALLVESNRSEKL